MKPYRRERKFSISRGLRSKSGFPATSRRRGTANTAFASTGGSAGRADREGLDASMNSITAISQSYISSVPTSRNAGGRRWRNMRRSGRRCPGGNRRRRAARCRFTPKTRWKLSHDGVD